jgi:hypothetical protein
MGLTKRSDGYHVAFRVPTSEDGKIKPRDVEKYRAQRIKKDGGRLAFKTINNDHTALKHYLNVAGRRGLLASNPAAKVPMSNP